MAEKEYIERGALIAEIDRNEPSNWTDTEAEIQSILDYRLYKGIAISQPAADVVEVVRCKDCKHFIAEMIGDSLECICKFAVGMVHISPISYCSYGERKEQK